MSFNLSRMGIKVVVYLTGKDADTLDALGTKLGLTRPETLRWLVHHTQELEQAIQRDAVMPPLEDPTW